MKQAEEVPPACLYADLPPESRLLFRRRGGTDASRFASSALSINELRFEGFSPTI
jgi:hypothetical protein